MPVKRSVEATAAGPAKVMTLDELAAFVEEARRAEVPGDSTVWVKSRIRDSRIMAVRIEDPIRKP